MGDPLCHAYRDKLSKLNWLKRQRFCSYNINILGGRL
jgi:hypothetical protein